MQRIFSTCAAIIILSGCAYTPMTVDLQPDTTTSISDIGEGQTVYLQVVDERTEQTVGNRGAAAFKGAAITLDQDLAATVQKALAEMLVAKGFDVVYSETDSVGSKLRVDIRGLSYETSTGFWTGGVQ